ncbi:MAG: c-type cytochrome [Betaproteobacteria bacterium]|nr:c-type cytochrome [Betaproteobacteria bacterium]
MRISRLALWWPMMLVAPALYAQDGRTLFLDAGKGRCAHCHQVPGDTNIRSLSTIGPPLVNIKEKFPTPEALDAAIGDFEKKKPGSFMPPFRKYRLLNDAEIAAIARYVWTL